MSVAAIADGPNAIEVARGLGRGVGKAGGDVADDLPCCILEVARRRFLKLVIRAVDHGGPADVVRRSTLHLRRDARLRFVRSGAGGERLSHHERGNRGCRRGASVEERFDIPLHGAGRERDGQLVGRRRPDDAGALIVDRGPTFVRLRVRHVRPGETDQIPQPARTINRRLIQGAAAVARAGRDRECAVLRFRRRAAGEECDHPPFV